MTSQHIPLVIAGCVIAAILTMYLYGRISHTHPHDEGHTHDG